MIQTINYWIEILELNIFHDLRQSIAYLSSILSLRDFSPIIVPLQSSLTVTLPTSHHQHTDHNPFPGIQPTIIRFDDKVKSYIVNFCILSILSSKCLNQKLVLTPKLPFKYIT